MAIKLGDKVVDVLTGLKGIAWAKIQYLTSPDQIGIILPADDNKPGEVVYVDEDRLLATTITELQMVKYGESKND